jgi:hypothetical protein
LCHISTIFLNGKAEDDFVFKASHITFPDIGCANFVTVHKNDREREFPSFPPNFDDNILILPSVLHL